MYPPKLDKYETNTPTTLRDKKLLGGKLDSKG